MDMVREHLKELYFVLGTVLAAVMLGVFVSPGCALLLVPSILAVAGLWLFRRLSRRGFGSAIAMDGVTCLKGGDGSVVIRKQSFRNWLVLIFLGLCLLGIIALLPLAIRALFESTSVLEDILELGTIVGIGGLIGAAMLVLARSLRGRSTRIDATAGVLNFGRGSSSRSIPFTSIVRVVVEPRGTYTTEDVEMSVFGISVLLGDGDTLQLGTVSGAPAKARERAAMIAQWVADATGAPKDERG